MSGLCLCSPLHTPPFTLPLTPAQAGASLLKMRSPLDHTRKPTPETARDPRLRGEERVEGMTIYVRNV